MKSLRSAFFCAFLWALLAWITPATAQTTAIKTLVLYDAPAATVDANKLGKAYAIMLRNLLGHWNTTVDMLPVQSYTTGRLANYDATFYIGSHYDNPVPATFLVDVHSSTKTVVWFKYNIWQYAWNSVFDFNTKYGLWFQDLRGMNAPPSATNPNPGFFSDVSYKGRTLTKYYDYNAITNTMAADPDVGATSILDPVKAQALVSIRNPAAGTELPYIVRSGNFWYVADLPLSYIGPRDRYLVLCDILHDMLGVNTPASKRALVRFEDVSFLVNPATTSTLTDELWNFLVDGVRRPIPFGVAVIPRYRDPLGAYNGGVPQEVALANATQLKNALNYMKTRGGRFVAHGWTHQYSNVKNPWTGVSGDDFEFWNIVANTPTANDTVANATSRINSARNEMIAATYTPFAWEMPHYQASPRAYQAARSIFAKSWGRIVYYTSDTTPNLAPGNANRDFAVGQFFPYVIQKDYYNNKVLPENLGNIEYDLGEIDPSSNYNYTAADILLNADMVSVVRDGFASFFFHPFWLEPEIDRPGLADFRAVINGITARGYTWVDPSTL